MTALAAEWSDADGLVCPMDRSPLSLQGEVWRSANGRTYRSLEGIPVLLGDAAPTTGAYAAALDPVRSLAMAAEDRAFDGVGVHPHVARTIVNVAGHLYRARVNDLAHYPIPLLRLDEGEGRRLLDVGCGWGRWSVAASRLGYEVVGVDPSLARILAARQVARQLGVTARFLIAEARALPFAEGAFDTVFSYSVLQHLAPDDMRQAVSEVGRVVRPGGESLIQMANGWGLVSLYHQARRGFGPGRNFDVRYYSPFKLQRIFEAALGPTDRTVDGFFGLGVQASDRDILPTFERTVVAASEVLRAAANLVPPLGWFADSVYLRSRRPG